jgi:hypothetical protein
LSPYLFEILLYSSGFKRNYSLLHFRNCSKVNRKKDLLLPR